MNDSTNFKNTEWLITLVAVFTVTLVHNAV